MNPYIAAIFMTLLAISGGLLLVNYGATLAKSGIHIAKPSPAQCSAKAVVQSGMLLLSHTNASGPDWDSAYLYRQSFNVSNPGVVEIVIDTATPIAEGKMEPDCSDIKVEFNGSEIQYWLEGGCNTTETRLLASIPSNGTGYIYYDGPGGSRLDWNGKFFFMFNSSCPDGFQMESGENQTFYHRFFMGNSSYGQTGGSETHNHGGSFSFSSGPPLENPDGYGTVCTTKCLSNPTVKSHTHTITVSISEAQNLPPYFDVVVCSSGSFSQKDGMIFMHDSESAGDIGFHGRLPRGSDSYGATGGSTTHTHGYSVYIASSAVTCGSTWCDSGDQANLGPHPHSVASSSFSQASSMPPYLTLRFSTSADNAILMADSVPPLGYSRYSALDSRFPMSNATIGVAGGSETHVHHVSVTTNIVHSSDYRKGTKGGDGVAAPYYFVGYDDSHHHSASTDTPADSNIPPYVSVVFLKRNVSETVVAHSEERRVDIPTTTIRIPLENVGSGVFKSTEAFVATSSGTYKASANITVEEGMFSYGEIIVNASVDREEIREIRILPSGCLDPVPIRE